MTLQTYFSALAKGMDLVAQVSGASKAQLVDLGATPDHADELLALHDTYFGPTPYTRKQSRARATTLGLHDIQLVERFVRRTKKQLDRWRLREELLHLPAADISRVARQRLAELNPPKPQEDGVRILRGKRKWKLILTGPSKLIGEMFVGQDGTLETFYNKFFNGQSKPEYAINVVVTAEDLVEILDGTGDETLLRCTNGQVMTGAQLMQSKLSDLGFAALVHPVLGPLDLGTIQRLASDKQRKLASIENPTCAWPGCHCPADLSQVHHIIAAKDGGPTNMSNLLLLCPYHNGVNEDQKVKNRGRMIKVNGKSAWCSPFGGPPVITHPGYRAPLLV